MTDKNSVGETSNLKQTWLAQCAHELRIPIAQIDAAVEMLILDNEKNILSNEEKQQYLQDVIAANQSLHHLVEDCIAFIKGRQTDFQLQVTRCHLKSLLNQLHHSFLGQMHEGIELHYDYPDSLPEYVMGDRQRINQCVANLIRNAAKFTEKGSITLQVLRTNSKPDMLKVVVSDTGIGISKEKLATIWDAFIKVHDAAVDQKMQRHQGLGLGLAIVRQFVTQMNGEVGVKSIVGEGSKFYLTLPIAD